MILSIVKQYHFEYFSENEYRIFQIYANILLNK